MTDWAVIGFLVALAALGCGGFENLKSDINKRFEDVNKRFDKVDSDINRGKDICLREKVEMTDWVVRKWIFTKKQLPDHGQGVLILERECAEKASRGIYIEGLGKLPKGFYVYSISCGVPFAINAVRDVYAWIPLEDF